jgi:glutaminyl-tRNA synthetase
MLEIENNPEDSNSGVREVPFSGELWIERGDFVINPDKKYNNDIMLLRSPKTTFL